MGCSGYAGIAYGDGNFATVHGIEYGCAVVTMAFKSEAIDWLETDFFFGDVVEFGLAADAACHCRILLKKWVG